MGNFNESQHPRVPAGSPTGGRFTSGGEGYVISGRGTGNLDEHLAHTGKQFLNRPLTKENVARMAGAPPGAEVDIEVSSSDELVVTSRIQNKYWSHRVINFRARTVFNEESKVYEEHGKKGIATEALIRQVTEARAMGMHRIETYAAGKGKGEKGGGKLGLYNGYYTWARLGFMPYNYHVDVGSSQTVQDRHGNSLNLIRLMSTKAGREYWKDNGSSFSAAFDLRPESISSRVLDAYTRAREERS